MDGRTDGWDELMDGRIFGWDELVDGRIDRCTSWLKDGLPDGEWTDGRIE